MMGLADNSKHALKLVNLKETIDVTFVGMTINLDKNYSQYL